MKRTNKRGFTLVELVVVIAVLLILAAIAIPTVSGIIARANESTDDANAQSIETAIKYAIAANETNTIPEGYLDDNKISLSEALELSGMTTSILESKTGNGFYYNQTTNDVKVGAEDGYNELTEASAIYIVKIVE